MTMPALELAFEGAIEKIRFAAGEPLDDAASEAAEPKRHNLTPELFDAMFGQGNPIIARTSGGKPPPSRAGRQPLPTA